MRRLRRRTDSGFALVLALFVLTTLVIAATSALLSGSADIRATRNYREASQAHFVAESGIAHAMQVVNGIGVVNFQNDIANQWASLFGTGSRSFGPVAGYTYVVTASPDLADPAGHGWLVSTASGPESARNVVVAHVSRSIIPSTAPGALYLSQDGQTNATFNGTSFRVDGNDHLLTGGLATPNNPIPGISTRNDANTQEAISSLSSGQRSDVTGLGFIPGSPATPSILTSPAAPSVNQLNQIATDLIGRPGVVVNSTDQITGHASLGTTDAPQITYFNSSDGITIKGAGNVDGAGILIVEGDLTIQGSLSFSGLIIVRGRTQLQGTTTDTGNATLYGSLWTNDVNLTVGGSAIVYYSSQALSLANQVTSSSPGALPAPIQLTCADCWLVDCAQATGTATGCP